MRLFKLMAIVAALALALMGCELDEEGADGGGTGGQDVAGGTDTGDQPPPPTCEGTAVGTNFDLSGDDNCNQALFFDVDCQGVANNQFTFRCGKSKCDYTDNICESMQPCGTVFCYDNVQFGKPCPNDPDCFSTGDEPALACEQDGHCDTWCPNASNGLSIDPDCSSGGEYCPGGSKVSQCN
jgi:hypothetical protein